MTEIKLRIERYLNGIKAEDNNIDEYFLIDLSTFSENSQIANIVAIKFLFDIINKKNPQDLTKEDIYKFLKCKRFIKLHNRSKNLHIIYIRKYLKFSKRKDLIEILPKKYKIKKEELDVNLLITRDDLKEIFDNSGIKQRALIMTLYEGALRKNELLNILYKDLIFDKSRNCHILRIRKSKTIARNIPIIESMPYLKEWFARNNFKPNDKIFFYKNIGSLNVIFNDLKKRLIKKNPKRWDGRKLNPHLFRHSRLTELARTKCNEASLCKFAGWTSGSDMARVYFHLTDDDIIEIITGTEVEKPTIEKMKTKICGICTAVNSEQNLFCWKCNNVLDEKDLKKAGIELISQDDKVEALTNKLNNLEQLVKELVSKAFIEAEKKAEKDTNKVLGIAEKEYGMNIWDKYEINKLKKPKK